jgi:hypothetical protein
MFDPRQFGEVTAFELNQTCVLTPESSVWRAQLIHPGTAAVRA